MKNNIHVQNADELVSISRTCKSFAFNLTVKVIPLKLFYYQTFFETWRNEHS